jgi:S-adenosylmethionine hydrolase
MPDPVVTLTTDFGDDGPYVAAMKGVILSVNPAARIIDLTHEIPPHDIRHAAFFLANALPYFPPGCIHVVVVDPGVGSSRALLYIESSRQRIIAPDNGCWTLLPEPSLVRRIENPRYGRPHISATFHGRDILAPVAGWLSRGLDPANLGTVTNDWVRLRLPEPSRTDGHVSGEVVFVDRFGNLITNIPGDWLPELGVGATCVMVGSEAVTHRVRTYADAELGTAAALVSSFGTLEIGVVQGNAAERLKAGLGTPVKIC